VKRPWILLAVAFICWSNRLSADVFATPAEVCAILTKQGVELPLWNKLPSGGGLDEYFCGSGLQTITPSSSIKVPANNIAIYVSGKHKEYAELIELTVNINDNKNRDEAIKKFKITAKTLITKFSVGVPQYFMNNIQTLKVTCALTDFGKAIIDYDRSAIDSYKLSLVRANATVLMDEPSPPAKKCH